MSDLPRFVRWIRDPRDVRNKPEILTHMESCVCDIYRVDTLQIGSDFDETEDYSGRWYEQEPIYETIYRTELGYFENESFEALEQQLEVELQRLIKIGILPKTDWECGNLSTVETLL